MAQALALEPYSKLLDSVQDAAVQGLNYHTEWGGVVDGVGMGGALTGAEMHADGDTLAVRSGFEDQDGSDPRSQAKATPPECDCMRPLREDLSGPQGEPASCPCAACKA